MSWKRLFVSIPLGFLILIADGVLLMLVNRLYRPGHPPAWVIAAFFYFDAWPLFITQRIFPRAPGDTFGGPTFLAVAAAGLINLIVFSAIVYALLSWRARRRIRV
jgi:hypothetical protein